MAMLFSVPLAVVAIAATALLGLYRLLQIGKRDPRMPKGPKTIPILGNLHQVPATGLFKQCVYPTQEPHFSEHELMHSPEGLGFVTGLRNTDRSSL